MILCRGDTFSIDEAYRNILADTSPKSIRGKSKS